MLDQENIHIGLSIKDISDSKMNYINGGQLTRKFSKRDEEMLRLIGQFLCDKGFTNAYAQLSKESGITLEHSDATELRRAVLEGRWEDAELAIDKLSPMIGDINRVEEIRFLLLEERFLEYLEANDVMPAITLLRNRITPMQRNTERVHTLASCLMCRTTTELLAQAGGWAGVDLGSRLHLINRIQSFIPAQTMLPPGRLEELINESVRAQLSSCIFHNPPMGVQTDLNSISLLQRHSCGMQDFPAFCIQTLDQRDSDLWSCQFSPDGSYLAAGGKEANIDVWRVDPIRHAVTFFRVLTTHACVGCICWSPDSKKIAACCGEEQSCVIVYDAFSGQQLCNQKVNDEDIYSTAAFFSDNRKLAFGGLKGSFYVMDTEDQGRILTMVEGYRVQSMVAILPPIPSVLLPNGTETAQVNTPEISTPGAPDSSMNRTRLDGNILTEPLSHVEDQYDQLLVADSLHRVRLFRFGPLSTSSNSVPVSDAMSVSATTSTLTEVPTTSVSTIIVSNVIGSSTLSQTHIPTTASDEGSATGGLASNTSALAVYLSSGGVPGAPNPVSISSLASSGGTTNPIGYNSGNTGDGAGAAGSDNPAVAAALAVARLAQQQQQQQQRLLQANPTSAISAAGSWYHQPYSSPGSTYTSGSSTLPPGILLDMPILPVSLTRLAPPNTQGIQTQLGLQSLLHHSGSLHGSDPYGVVSTTSAANLGTSTGRSLTILFGAPLERSLASYVNTSITTTTASTPTGVQALAAAAAALATSNARSYPTQVHTLSGKFFHFPPTNIPYSGAASRITATPVTTSLLSTTVCTTSTSTIESVSVSAHSAPGTASLITTMPSTTTPTVATTGTSMVSSTTTSTTATTTTSSGAASVATVSEFSTTNTSAIGSSTSSYGLLDHRTLFKETHPIQSITISRSGTQALITIHKMGLHLWDLEACSILQRFVGLKQDTFRLHSTFGGNKEDFVATGSENGRVHIWHVASGSHPIHSSTASTNRDPVTCVHWNPVLPTMMASVNDAGELCIWGPQRYTLGSGQPMDSST